MKKYDIKHRFAYIQYQVRELDITVQSNRPWGKAYVDRYIESRDAYYAEEDYLDTLQELGYQYYEKDPEKADINDLEYVEKDETFEMNPQNEPVNIKELYEKCGSFKAIINGISIEGIEKLFKNSDVDSQIFATKKLENDIRELEDQCIIIENTLLGFESREYNGFNARKVNGWAYDLNKKELERLTERNAYNKLLNRFIDYLDSNGIEYETEDRDTFGTGKVKCKRIVPKEEDTSKGFRK